MSLPPEIVSQIIDSADERPSLRILEYRVSHRSRTLTVTALVNRIWLRETRRILYRRVHVQEDLPMTQLSRTLQREPSLGLLIRELRGIVDPLTRHQLPATVLANIITLAPEVRKLELFVWQYENMEGRELLRSALGSLSNLQDFNMQTTSLTHRAEFLYSRSECLRMLQCWPKIRTADFGRYPSTYSPSSSSPPAPGVLDVVFNPCLHLRNFQMDVRFDEQWISLLSQVAPFLSELDIPYGGLASLEGRALNLALQTWSSTLTTLRLMGPPIPRTDSAAVHVLSSLSEIHTLEASYTIFKPADFSATSLRRLESLHYHLEGSDALAQLLHAFKESPPIFPALQDLVVNHYIGHDGHYPVVYSGATATIVGQLRILCEARDISFKYML